MAACGPTHPKLSQLGIGWVILGTRAVSRIAHYSRHSPLYSDFVEVSVCVMVITVPSIVDSKFPQMHCEKLCTTSGD